MSSYVARSGKVLPERSSTDAWAKADKMSPELILTGDLVFNPDSGAPLFSFILEPMKAQRSNRFTRKWRADRFLILGLPGLSPKDLPQHLKTDASQVRDFIIRWLCESEHYILGRKWKAFFVKPRQKSAKSRQSNTQKSGEVMHRVYLFAVDGFGLMVPNVSMTVKTMLDWFMPAQLNKHQAVLKLFARIALGKIVTNLSNTADSKSGVSSTKATVVFNSNEIIRSDDAFADSPTVRRLNIRRSKEKRDERNDMPQI